MEELLLNYERDLKKFSREKELENIKQVEKHESQKHMFYHVSVRILKQERKQMQRCLGGNISNDNYFEYFSICERHGFSNLQAQQVQT